MANPTIIIAHCAFHQAAHYETFTTSMNEAGFSRVHTSQLPSAGHIPPEDAFTKEVTVLLQAIASELLAGNDVMVLAHSYGGIPVTEALIEIGKDVKGEAGKILGIVFVAAMMPDDGENLATAMKTGVAPWVKIEGEICRADNPAQTFYNLLSDQGLVSKAVEQITPQATAAFTTPVIQASWKAYPCTYVKCMQDNSTSLDDQDHMIEKLDKANPANSKTELESDHYPMLCMPERLVKIVRDAINGFKP